MGPKAGRTLSTVAAFLISVSGPLTAVEGVSPGEAERIVQAASTCPTFSWEEADGAVGYDITAYALADEEQLSRLGPDPATDQLYTGTLSRQISARTTSWTPSAHECFSRGGRFVWFVRPVFESDSGKASTWSRGRYFSTPAGPTADEVQRALEVFRAWSEGGGKYTSSQSPNDPGITAEAPEGPIPGPVAPSSAHAVPSAAAAIRAEIPGLSGELYGLVGISSSTGGAGVAAANLEGGPDLVLDGSADSVPGVELSEWGLNRPGMTDQTFTLQNSDTGNLNLNVVGDLQGHSANFQELLVNSSTAIDSSGNWQGSGDTIPCTSCVTASDLAVGSVTAAQIAAEAVGTSEIEDGAVGTNDIDSGAVGTTALAANAVTSAKIAAGAVGTVDLADNAVTSAKIIANTITAGDIATNAVGSQEIAVGAVGTDEIANDAVTTNHIGDGALTYRDLAAGSVRTSAILDGTIASADLANSSVTGVKILSGTVTSAHLANETVTNADLADNAVTSLKIAANGITVSDIANAAVNSDKILNGTITASDVSTSGGVYASKSGVYLVTESLTLPTSVCGSSSASCSDSNDLPLSCEWWGDDYARFHALRLENWDVTNQAATCKANFCNESTSDTKDIHSSIACLAVPGP